MKISAEFFDITASVGYLQPQESVELFFREEDPELDRDLTRQTIEIRVKKPDSCKIVADVLVRDVYPLISISPGYALIAGRRNVLACETTTRASQEGWCESDVMQVFAGKTGLVVCESGVYKMELGRDAVFVPFSDLCTGCELVGSELKCFLDDSSVVVVELQSPIG